MVLLLRIILKEYLGRITCYCSAAIDIEEVDCEREKGEVNEL